MANHDENRPQAAQDDTFQWVGERRRMAHVPYVLPKDEQEVSRLDFQPYMLHYVLQSNYLAPIQRPQRILDVGCGTGRWATEMAAAFPIAKVVGVDMVDQTGQMDPNPTRRFAFMQANVLEGLPFAANTFDFVHMRLLLFAIPAERWPQVLRELLRVTRALAAGSSPLKPGHSSSVDLLWNKSWPGSPWLAVVAASISCLVPE
ncbi:MAG TPA: methyltransferase domain-containing protein [Ktedonobacteraceae bacterium]|jgi:SAM-dependent methyltransferase|nr:methyltransferase domain-containing protein [Ktedonobacteraceae bacterium]